ncbi:MAG: hypothetical protein E7498_02775 [Ruminococcus sp.]|nr:hypothetical protein [Ruminococcus sp.]
MFKLILSALMSSATVLTSVPSSAYAETASRANSESNHAHVHEHDDCEETDEHAHEDCNEEDVLGSCAEEHEHAEDAACCDSHEELLLGDGITVAVLDSGITSIETAKDISFVDDEEFSEHGNMMAETLINKVPEIALYDVRVLDSEGKGKYSDISEAIVWSVDNDADIIVMSFEGFEASTILEDAINYAAQNDVLMIAAAGNDGLEKAVYPAAYSSVISAGSLAEDGTISPISNYGVSVDVFINAAEGTSYAAQYVAADAVKFMQANPDADSDEVRAVLTGNKSKEFTAVSGSEDSYVYAAACSHSWGSWVTTKNATCTTTGSRYRICSKCRTRQTSTISSYGHYVSSGSYNTTKYPTCTTTGTKVLYCSRSGCRAVLSSQTIPALGHSIKSTVVSPTCTAQGYTIKDCTRSGCSYYTKTNYTAARGHNWGSWITSKAATCTTAGSKYHTCTRCYTKQTSTIPAYGHSIKSTVVSPTCTAQGYTINDCTRSGCSYYTKTNYKAALGHNWGSWVTTKAATCTTAGSRYHTCTRCKTKQTSTIPALGHSIKSTVVAPTCTAQGYTINDCTRSGCSYSTKSNYKPALGHNWGSWVTTKNATCTTAGSRYHTCTRCKTKQTSTIPAYGHSIKSTVVNPTCTAQGYTLNDCTRSGCSYYTKTNYKAALGHSIKTTVVNPTCTAQGYTIKDCTRSGCSYYTKTNYKAALGHNWGSWVITKAATCTTTGSKYHICTRCKTKQTSIIPAPGHSIKSTVVNPTCTAQGYTLKDCTRSGCSYSTKSNYKPALGHSIKTTVVKPTCTTPGYTIKDCTRSGCSYYSKITIPATGHNWGSWVITKAAKCTTTGSKYRVCSVCKTKQVSTISALGHSWKASKTVAPTCTEKGYTLYVCSRSGCTATKKTNYKATLGHSIKTTVVKPTCTSKGYTLKDCTRSGCSYYVKSNYTSELGHYVSSGSYNTIKAATCTTKGEKVLYCSRSGCKAILDRQEIPALGHSIKTTVVKPTCTAKGYTLKDCTRSGCSYYVKSNYTSELGHYVSSGSYSTIKEATCTEKGVKGLYCSRSGCKTVLDKQDIPAKGHSWESTWTIRLKPTCSREGSKVRSCQRTGCTEHQSEKIAKLDAQLLGTVNINGNNKSVYIVENLSNASQLSDSVIIYDAVESDGYVNYQVRDSYKINDLGAMSDICDMIIEYNSDAGRSRWDRTNASLVAEWVEHNALYLVPNGDIKDCAQHVDLDEDAEGTPAGVVNGIIK